ncbi:MAG TPA: sulfatase-like hydrolase/transferase [Bryobacteraceae bacterium]|nr:sulfatase-like hydrolase/transferase [Bryobacteraceae bacterium]
MKRRDFLASGLLAATAAAAARKPNFLFVLADQFRGDALGVDGNSFVHTPNLDRLAKGGVRFANAYAPQAVCTPSRASLLTGVFPTTHGLTDNVYGIDSVFALRQYRLEPHYPGLLRAAGYVTGYIGKWHLGERPPGFFDYFSGYNSQWPHWLGQRDNSAYRSDVETDDAMKFIEQNARKPFLLTVGYYPPHDPYDPPRRFYAYYTGKNVDHADYYAACTAIDWNVGRLLDRLDRLGLARDTMVIFTSEHGETFGQRPLSGNKRVSYEESARVPLLLRYPAVLPAGAIYEGGVSTIDIMPTMLAAAGLPIPARVEGKNRIQEILSGATAWKEPVFQQNITQPKIMGGPHDERMVRLREWKLILRRLRTPNPPNMDELYNLKEDPREQHNRIAEASLKPKVHELAALMLAWGKRINDPLAVEMASRYARA